ncbi:MAG: NAD/NADP octopine/nopaline dehydrogenase family protein [Myxococcales bacterium]|nr:NAD/NADP octopine/nopaline dehydrogenase family protein [Myxococcales bacterium]
MSASTQERRSIANRTACVLGAGNAAHLVAALVSALPDWQCHVFAPRKDRASQWRAGIARGGITVTGLPQPVVGVPARVSRYASEVVPGCEVILLCVPAHACDEVLRAAAPYVDQGALIGSVGGSAGVDWAIDDAMANTGRSPDSYGVFSFINLPWVCRVTTYGHTVRVMAVKSHMPLAVRPQGRFVEIASLLQGIVGSSCPLAPGGFIEVGLANICQIIHPFIMKDHFGAWRPRQREVGPPLFYQGLSPEAADRIDRASSELLAVHAALAQHLPQLHDSHVRHVGDWLDWAYGTDISDRRSLHRKFVSNRSYAGLTCPVRQTDLGWRPDFQHRYLAEDVPCNLVALRGLAEMVQVRTPTIDAVIYWAQSVLGLEMLTAGQVRGADVHRTLAPQRFGLRTIEQVVAHTRHGDRPRAAAPVEQREQLEQLEQLEQRGAA